MLIAYVIADSTINMHQNKGIVMLTALSLLHWKTSRHDANFVLNGGTTGCHDDNLWCHQWQQSWHHEDFQLSALGCKAINLYTSSADGSV